MILNYKEIVELFSREGREFYRFICRSAGYRPSSLKLYRRAFVHRSVDAEENNERMEFLGDAVIEAVVSVVLCEVFPEWKEGDLSKLRSKLVCRQRLNGVAESLGFIERIRVHSHRVVEGSHIAGDAVEAFVAAVYLDGGMAKAEAFVRRHIADKKHIEEAVSEDEVKNYKSDLVNLGGRHGIEVFFVTRYIDGRSSLKQDRTDNFVSTVRIKDVDVADATGRSKKIAEQEAAHKALEIISGDPEFWSRGTTAETAAPEAEEGAEGAGESAEGSREE